MFFKHILKIGIISLLLTGCGFGNVEVKDRRGNKYTFKPDSVTCFSGMFGGIYCEGSAIKKDIAGRRYVVQLSKKLCQSPYKNSTAFTEPSSIICAGARKIGEYTPRD